MKVALIVLLVFFTYLPSQAQKRGKYRIKIIEHNHKRHRGIFYAANDDGLIIANRRGDTAKISSENIAALYISRPGIVVPFAVVGAAALFIIGVETPGINGSALTFLGPPLGVAGGLLLSQPFANKRYYRKLEPKDFPIIKNDLRKYTVIK